MPNMSQKKNPMPVQDAKLRATNFEEVALGYSPEQARDEALRCLNCKNKPCVSGCPVAVDIPAFLAKVAAGDATRAPMTLFRRRAACPPCAAGCARRKTSARSTARAATRGSRLPSGGWSGMLPTAISPATPGAEEPVTLNGHRVAIVGAGPAGLTCAGDLARLGYAVTIFEALHVAGGVLVYGIPEFRLPKRIVAREIEGLKAMGVDIQTNMVIGKVLSVDELFEEGFEAVFLGSGSGLPSFMGIPGENLRGVFSANEFLTRINLMKAYQPGAATPIYRGSQVVVVGGGNVAMDAARCALRLGADQVSIVYRRSHQELPARAEEIEHAKEEGVVFRLLSNPVRILGDDKHCVTGVRCVEMELGEPDESGRRRPMEKRDSEFTIDADCVIMAIGTSPNPLLRTTTPGLESNRRGGLIVEEETGLTTKEMVYAGGDVVTGSATVIMAMGAGKKAAAAIHKALSEKKA